MTGPARAITSLGKIEDRLRPFLNLAGEVGLVWIPEMRPVVLAGDATSPGNNPLTLRRWSVSISLASAAAACYTLKLNTAVVLTRVSGATSSGAELQLAYGAPDLADPGYAISITDAIWAERTLRDTDRAPILRSAQQADIAYGTRIVGGRITTSFNEFIGPDAGYHFEAGSKLHIRYNAALPDGFLNLYGYIY